MGPRFLATEIIPLSGTMMRRSIVFLVLCGVFAGAGVPLLAKDWPTYRRDRLRSAVTSEKLVLPLKNVWMYRSRLSWHAPKDQPSPSDRTRPAGRFGGKHSYVTPLMPNENRSALPIIAVGGAIFFTASDGRVVCLDAASGTKRWEFFTGGPISCAATHDDGKIYVGSDDGCAYCLDAATGKLIWKHKAIEQDRWFISYGWLSSMWPVRTDVLVDNGVAYFGAGVFPHDGMFVNAVDAKTGKRLWRTECERFGLAGHILATQAKLYFPIESKGLRSHPMFRRKDGVHDWISPDDELKQVRLYKNEFGAIQNGLRHLGEMATPDLDKRHGQSTVNRGWNKWGSMPGRFPDVSKVVYAGGTIFYLAHDTSMWGGKYPLRNKGGAVFARDAKNGDVLWSFDFPERPYHLIVANGRLLVSTRGGTIYCFAAKEQTGHGIVNETIEPDPFPRTDEFNRAAGAAHHAKAISSVSEGYAVVLDCDSGGLPFELVRQSKLYVCAVFDDPAKALAARKKYTRAGVHASRICVWHQKPDAPLPFPAKFADLVLSERAIAGEQMPEDVSEVNRLLKPIRGIAVIGGGKSDATVKTWIEAANESTNESSRWKYLERNATHWATRVRPPVVDGGGWAGPLGGPGRTNNSHDKALKGPLGVVWYGPPFIEQAIGRPPLMMSGVMVCPTDNDTLEAYDQYNGRLLWKYTAKNFAGHVASAGVAGGEYLYTVYNGRCLRMSLYEGGRPTKIANVFEGAQWGRIAVSGDGKTLWGQGFAKDEKGNIAWSGVFAIEAASGKTRWTLGGPDTVTVDTSRRWQGWQAISDGRMYFVSGRAKGIRLKEATQELRAYLKKHDATRLKDFEETLKTNRRSLNVLTAVDAQTGKHLYDHGIDMTNCGWIAAHNGFVISGAGGGRKNVVGGPKTAGLAAWDGATGQLAWNRPGEHSFLPVVTGDAIYAEPWAYDLRTGQRRKRKHPVSGKPADVAWARYGKHCGGYNGSEHFLFGRNMGFGYQDILRDNGMYTFWHSRIACNTDVTSGGGMLVKPPMALGCRCDWSQPFTIALAPVKKEPAASFLSFHPGEALPIKHLRLNFTATGDRRDRTGHLWLKNDRREIGHVKQFQGRFKPKVLWYANVAPLHEYVDRSSVHTKIENTDTPFLFASTARGVKRWTIPVTTPEHGRGVYQVRLGFAALPGDKPGQRVFDVLLNGKTVLSNFDIVAAAGRSDRALWKEFTLNIDGDLVMSFVAKKDKPIYDQMPLISAVEVIRLK